MPAEETDLTMPHQLGRVMTKPSKSKAFSRLGYNSAACILVPQGAMELALEKFVSICDQ